MTHYMNTLLCKRGWFQGPFGFIRIVKLIGGLILMSTPLIFLILTFTHSGYALIPMMVSGWPMYGGWNWFVYGDLTGAIETDE